MPDIAHFKAILEVCPRPSNPPSTLNDSVDLVISVGLLGRGHRAWFILPFTDCVLWSEEETRNYGAIEFDGVVSVEFLIEILHVSKRKKAVLEQRPFPMNVNGYITRC